jgi:hypothetical protein
LAKSLKNEESSLEQVKEQRKTSRGLKSAVDLSGKIPSPKKPSTPAEILPVIAPQKSVQKKGLQLYRDLVEMEGGKTILLGGALSLEIQPLEGVSGVVTNDATLPVEFRGEHFLIRISEDVVRQLLESVDLL